MSLSQTYFLDSSALVKRYHRELGTDGIDEIFKRPENSLWISRLGVVEFSSACAIKFRARAISRNQSDKVFLAFQHDIASGRIIVSPTGDRELLLAETLVDRYAFDMRLRTLDAIQLATAICLRVETRVARFVAADRALCDVARLEGFSVLNPEER